MTRCTEQEVQRLLPLVSEQRRQQALKYKHTFGQYCCLKSWLMLEEGMKTFNFQLSTFNYEKNGKPYVENGPYFSISHCKTAIAVAIDDRPIGIDIESIRHADDELIARTMNEEEKSQITNHKSQIESARAFTRLWTQKEAIVKLEGTGIESFEQLRSIRTQNTEYRIQTFENENYIYSIAYGKLHCFSA
ncbi:MAG: 4'-phosphopantetheinyl transferase superfamily protein [Paludibacteraceae bacterium]|nr:4'-phosphopantetheinyl transferase superfamily protein [Paludibacteraceae bacterium]